MDLDKLIEEISRIKTSHREQHGKIKNVLLKMAQEIKKIKSSSGAEPEREGVMEIPEEPATNTEAKDSIQAALNRLNKKG